MRAVAGPLERHRLGSLCESIRTAQVRDGRAIRKSHKSSERLRIDYCDTGICTASGRLHSPPAHGGNTPPNGEPVDAMFFKNYGTNPFISTDDDHLSTFAIDCDNASYTMTRAYLNDGNLPPEEAVRVEEFINNFKYTYNHPSDRAFDVEMEGAPSRFGKGYELLKIGVVGKKIRTENRKDANLTFVVDVSGSMAREDRLGLVRRSLRMLLDQLTPRDNVGIVVYGSTARIVLEPTSIRDKNKIIRAIEELGTGRLNQCRRRHPHGL